MMSGRVDGLTPVGASSGDDFERERERKNDVLRYTPVAPGTLRSAVLP